MSNGASQKGDKMEFLSALIELLRIILGLFNLWVEIKKLSHKD